MKSFSFRFTHDIKRSDYISINTMRVFRICACYIFSQRLFFYFFIFVTPYLKIDPIKGCTISHVNSKKANCKICSNKSGADQDFGCFTIVTVCLDKHFFLFRLMSKPWLPLEKEIFSVSFVLLEFLKVFKEVYITIQIHTLHYYRLRYFEL